jgi:hypothetical protein
MPWGQAARASAELSPRAFLALCQRDVSPQQLANELGGGVRFKFAGRHE